MLGKALGGAIALVAVVATVNQATATDDPPTSGPAPVSATVVEIKGAAIDGKYPGRVRVDLVYTCSAPDGARSLNTSVEQTDPEDKDNVAFGSTRTSPTTVVCDGTAHPQEVIVSSKTFNWLDGIDGIVVATVTDLGATPPAAADAKQLTLAVPRTGA